MTRRHDRGFSLIEAMVAAVVMLIGMLGLAGLQVVGMRANNVAKRMAQASLLAQDLAQNMELWQYTDARLIPQNNPALQTDTNSAAIAAFWDLKNTEAPTAADGSALQFDYADGPAPAGTALMTDQLAADYQGVQGPVDTSLPGTEQVIFTRYWNVYNVDLAGTGSPQGKLVQIVVRWKEPNFGFRSVTHSFFKYDPTGFIGL